jgi:hypothetical protein
MRLVKRLNVTIIILVVCKSKYNKIQFAIQYNKFYIVLVICVLKYNALFINYGGSSDTLSRIQFT